MGAGQDLIDTLTRPIGAAKRLLDAAAASTDPAYLKRKFRSKPKMPTPKPYLSEPVKK
jgi:hypothetical protein